MSFFGKKIDIIELGDVPQCCTGAPMPAVVSDEHHLAVIYALKDQSGAAVKPTTSRGRMPGDALVCAKVSFERVSIHKFGAPNDEALGGHPLFEHGLGFYGFFEVINSPWKQELIKQNSNRNPNSEPLFRAYRHFIFTFHDSTLEVMAEQYRAEALGQRSLLQVAAETVESWQG